MSLNHPEHTLDNPPPTQPVDAIAHWQRFAPELPADRVVWSETLPGGAHWSWRLRRGTALRFVALDERANVSLVLYATHSTLERYNMPDSLKAQHTAHYRAGHVLMSENGRSMASFTQDTLGWHDPLGALLDTPTMEAKYGQRRYEQQTHARTHEPMVSKQGRDRHDPRQAHLQSRARTCPAGAGWFSGQGGLRRGHGLGWKARHLETSPRARGPSLLGSQH